MKFISAIILSFLLLSSSLKVSITYSWYALDVESFIEQLCENKDKPAMQCNGKCFLMKVSKSSTSNPEKPATQIEWEQLVYCEVNSNTEQLAAPIYITTYNSHSLLINSEGNHTRIFRPPELVLLTSQIKLIGLSKAYSIIFT